METQHGRDPITVTPGTERIAAFSDGVIAIIITIMVLELKLPEGAAKGDGGPVSWRRWRRSSRSTR